MGRIAGAIGGGFARLTLDDKFIEERRRRQAEPKDAIGGVVEGGKGLVMVRCVDRYIQVISKALDKIFLAGHLMHTLSPPPPPPYPRLQHAVDMT